MVFSGGLVRYEWRFNRVLECFLSRILERVSMYQTIDCKFLNDPLNVQIDFDSMVQYCSILYFLVQHDMICMLILLINRSAWPSVLEAFVAESI